MSLVSNANLTVGIFDGATQSPPWCDVTDFKQEIVRSDDERTVVGILTTITGTVSFPSSDAYQNFRDFVYATQSVSKPVQYTVEMRDPGGAFVELSAWDEAFPDDIGGPFLEVSQAVEVTGVRYIRAGFTIKSQSARPNVDGEAGLPVPLVGVSWRQRTVIGADSRIVRHVEGLITTSSGNSTLAGGTQSPATNSTVAQWTTRAPFADLFRNAVIPPVPGYGWRRTSQEYAYNPRENALAFRFTDEQGRTDLPWPAQTGTFDFQVERTLADAGAARAQGRISLAGGLNQNPRQLIAGAFDLMAARIRPARDLIERLVVREKDITGSVSIEVEVDALIFSENTLNTASLAVTAMIGCPFVVKRAAASADVKRTVPPYGSPSMTVDGSWAETAKSYWMEPHWIDANPTFQTALAEAATLNQPTVIEFTDSAETGTVTVTVTNNDTFVSDMNATLEDGPYPTQYAKQADSGDFATTMLTGKANSRVYLHNGICRLCTAYNTGADYVFQIEKPMVALVEKQTVNRLNQNPAKSMRPTPANFFVADERWEVDAGAGDAQGNRSYVDTFVREAVAFDGGGATSGGFSSATIGSLTFRVYSPPASQVAGGLDPTMTSASQESTKAAIPASGGGFTDTKLVSATTASTVLT